LSIEVISALFRNGRAETFASALSLLHVLSVLAMLPWLGDGNLHLTTPIRSLACES
jgi:hypothetical protein